MIGIYDSGVGGLHILHAIRTVLPSIDIAYLADTRLVPLGEHTDAEIQHELEVACDWFFDKAQCSLVVLACNTASVVAIRHLQQEYLPQKKQTGNVLGINIPLLEYMKHHHADVKNSPGVVLSTMATYASQFYEKQLRSIGFNQVAGYGSARLARAIEYENQDGIADELRQLKQWCHEKWGRDPAYIVHACTHFPLAQLSFTEQFPDTFCIDHASYVADQLDSYLRYHPEYSAGSGGATTYYCSADASHMQARVNSLYGESIKVVEVSLGP